MQREEQGLAEATATCSSFGDRWMRGAGITVVIHLLKGSLYFSQPFFLGSPATGFLEENPY